MSNSLNVTHTRTYTVVEYANPHLICGVCKESTIGYREDTKRNLPCGHDANVVSKCHSWSPVDGCQCESRLLH